MSKKREVREEKQEVDTEDVINDVTFRLEEIFNFNYMLQSILESGAWDVQPEEGHPVALLAVVETMTNKTIQSAIDAANELSKVYPDYEELKRVIKHMEY
jgi:hypothetical protein